MAGVPVISNGPSGATCKAKRGAYIYIWTSTIDSYSPTLSACPKVTVRFTVNTSVCVSINLPNYSSLTASRTLALLPIIERSLSGFPTRQVALIAYISDSTPTDTSRAKRFSCFFGIIFVDVAASPTLNGVWRQIIRGQSCWPGDERYLEHGDRERRGY